MHEHEVKADADHRTSPSSSVVYEAIHSEGMTELERTRDALAWSGLAAGLSMGFSFLAVATLHAHLPHAKWTPLVAFLGYPLGFLIVILGRQQLFTENTLTVMLPLFTRSTKLRAVLRVWGTVLLTNTIGAILFALVVARTEAVEPKVFESMRTIAREAAGAGFLITMLRGIFAGWLIALVVWLLPFASTARVVVIFVLTYFVGAGHFTHIVAGTVDAAFLAFVHESSWAEFLMSFFIPALIGNVIGGVLLVAAMNHGQVKTDA